MNKTDRLLRMLQDSGPLGSSNSELASISLRYGAVIHKLRQIGHRIRTECVNFDTGYYRYYLEDNEVNGKL